jgi:hypothetical protein
MKTYGGVEVYLHNYWPRRYMKLSGQLHARRLYPRKFDPGVHWIEQYWEEKKFAPAGNRTPAVQPVDRRCTDWAMPTPEEREKQSIIL